MRYIEVKIYTAEQGVDPLTCILMDMGIAGFAIEDAADFEDLMNKKNSYDWDYIDESLMALADVETNITFYLEENNENLEKIDELRDLIANIKNKKTVTFEEKNLDYDTDFGRLEMIVKNVDDNDWKDNWKEYFKPARITDKIVIKPTWEEYDKKPGDLVIEIDPGMAFGTGTHPTTSLCVKLLEKYIEKDQDSVLDVGCGSGILAIAASLLGGKDVLGIEIDPVAVEVAKENVELNNLSSNIRVILGDLTKGIDEKADIVAANLMADLVIMLSKDVKKHLKGKGIYISSGILIEKKETVKDAIEKAGFEIIEILEEGEWCAICAKVKSDE